MLEVYSAVLRSSLKSNPDSYPHFKNLDLLLSRLPLTWYLLTSIWFPSLTF